MKLHQIKNINNIVIFEAKTETFKECVELAVKQNINLQFANLQRAKLQGANLQYVDLQEANLQEANLQYVDLQGANLQGADLQGAYLQEANLQGADLQGADLQGANLQGANIDFSCWPLWCGSQGVIGCTEQKKQLLVHAFNFALDEFPGGLTQEQKEWLNSGKRIQDNSFPKFE